MLPFFFAVTIGPKQRHLCTGEGMAFANEEVDVKGALI